MANNKISYTERDFVGIRNELLRYTQQQYPDLIKNTNDASIFSVFLDLNAAVADNLHYHIDRSLQETVLQFANQRSSLYNIARTYGLKIPGNRPSVSVADFSIVVPVLGDKENFNYLGLLRRNSQVKGAGQVFETRYDVDFSSPFDATGFPNRTKVPNFDSNNNIVSYTMTKREVVINGITKVFKRVLTDTDVRPFLKVFLPEKNILGVTAVIEKDGTNIQALPKSTEFINSPSQWYEVDALAQDKVFTLDPTKNSDSPGLKVGKWKQVDNRFTTEYTPEGFFHLTLGGGTSSGQDSLDDFASQGLAMDLNKYLNNLSLGRTAKSNSTLFIQYRIGGGTATNVGPNSITSLGQLEFIVTGPVDGINQQVKNSLKVNNITAAVGGANQPTVEEIRNYVSFNFASQQRAVTVSDYKAIIDTMPGVFGAPAKVGIVEEENKILINLLSYSDSGKLSSKVSTSLMSNIAEYISDYRMMNDYITIKSAEVVDLALEVDILADPSFNQGEIVTNIVSQVDEFFSPNKKEMGQNCYVGQLSKLISTQQGVINLIDLRVVNKVGGQYSDNQVSQRYSNPDTRQVELIDGVIFAQPNQSFQVQFPEKDVSIRIKSNAHTSIS
tara:strand:+ start:1037 stop:2875 length:1839 start_codon:yes stop_codon:yes gene_type:complete